MSGRDVVRNDLTSSALIAAIILLTVLAGVALFFGPDVLGETSTSDTMRVLHALGYLILIGGGAFTALRSSLGRSLNYAVVWLLVFAGIGALYKVLN